MSQKYQLSEEQKLLLDIYIHEYDKIKTEQTRRIGFRDNLLYVTLSLYSGIFSYAISDSSHYYAFLVLPWLCFVLGWTYLVNDEKISAIGHYTRSVLSKKISKLTGTSSEELFGWEISHRSDKFRISRKYFQLLVDEVTFSVSALFAIFTFWWVSVSQDTLILVFMFVDILFTIVLAIWIWIYADLAKG